MPMIANNFASRSFRENLGAAIWLESTFNVTLNNGAQITRADYCHEITQQAEEYCTCEECQYQDAAELEHSERESYWS
jgi:hypothetical protein